MAPFDPLSSQASPADGIKPRRRKQSIFFERRGTGAAARLLPDRPGTKKGGPGFLRKATFDERNRQDRRKTMQPPPPWAATYRTAFQACQLPLYKTCQS